MNNTAEREQLNKTPSQPFVNRKTVIFDNEEFVETFWLGYFVSRSGRVLSFKDPRRNLKDQIDYSKGRILKQGETQRGYKQVLFTKGVGIRKPFLVHRLVVETFIGPIPEGYQVDHIDCDPRNNNLSNLQVLTRRDNLIKSFQTSKRNSNRKRVIYTNPAGITQEFETIKNFHRQCRDYDWRDWLHMLRSGKKEFIQANVKVTRFYEDSTTIEIQIEQLRK